MFGLEVKKSHSLPMLFFFYSIDILGNKHFLQHLQFGDENCI
jgi:hypothetical protein